VLSGRTDWIDEIRRRSERWVLHAGKRSLRVESSSASLEDDLRTLASQLHWLTVVETATTRRKRRTSGRQ